MRHKKEFKDLAIEREKVVLGGASNDVQKEALLFILDALQELSGGDKRKKDMGWTDKLKIKGIGKETKLDIETVFPNEELLADAVKKGDRLPFLSNVVQKLKEHYSSFI